MTTHRSHGHSCLPLSGDDPPHQERERKMLQHRFEFGGTGALKSQRHGVKAQRTVECFEPLMKRPFEFLFPEKNATHKHFPLPRFVPDRTLLHGNLLAIACDAFHVPKSLRNRDTIQNRFPYFRGHVTDLYLLSRSGTVEKCVFTSGCTHRTCWNSQSNILSLNAPVPSTLTIQLPPGFAVPD